MKPIVIATTLVMALLAGVLVAVKVTQPKAIQFAKLYPQERELPTINLIDHNGERLATAWFNDQWTLVFVGYTFCPDICPTTLAELKSIYPQLSAIDSNHPIQVLFLSVDPKRDSTHRLKEYIEFFSHDFFAATAEHRDLFPAVRAMGMMYSMVDSTDSNDYLVDHSASVVIINPKAQVVGRFVPIYEPDRIAISDGAQILADMPVIIANYHKTS